MHHTELPQRRGRPRASPPDGVLETWGQYLANAAITRDTRTLFLDSRGRRLALYADFMLARDTNGFPVRYWRGKA